jgi:hypothetical protein
MPVLSLLSCSSIYAMLKPAALRQGTLMKISRVGEAPDYRFSLANERTFLAWIRTALGFLAAGVGLISWRRILPRR